MKWANLFKVDHYYCKCGQCFFQEENMIHCNHPNGMQKKYVYEHTDTVSKVSKNIDIDNIEEFVIVASDDEGVTEISDRLDEYYDDEDDTLEGLRLSTL